MIIITKTADVLIQPRVLKVARKVQSLGYDYKVVGMCSNKNYLKNDTGLNIENVSVESSNLLMSVNFFRRFWKLVKFIQALDFKGGEKYLVHDYFSLAIVCAFKILRRKIQIIYLGDELEIDRGFHSLKKYTVLFIMKFALNRCNYIFQADYYRKLALEEFLKGREVMLLRNVPEIKLSFKRINIKKKFNLNNETMIFVYHGVICKVRCIENYINAVSMLSDYTSCCLLIIGWGTDSYLNHINELKRMKEAQYDNFRLILLDPMPMNDLFDWIYSADIGMSLIKNISKSYFLCVPSKVYEFLMAGKPFIVSDFPESKLLVGKTGAGVLVDPDCENDILNKLTIMIKNKELLTKMGERGRRAALQMYNWEKESLILNTILQ